MKTKLINDLETIMLAFNKKVDEIKMEQDIYPTIVNGKLTVCFDETTEEKRDKSDKKYNCISGGFVKDFKDVAHLINPEGLHPDGWTAKYLKENNIIHSNG